MTSSHRVIGPMGIKAMVVVLAGTLSACSSTTYVPYSEDRTAQNQSLVRTIAFDVDPQFEAFPPSCVVTIVVADEPVESLSQVIDSAVRRHLSERVDDVVDPRRKNEKLQGLLISLNSSVERRILASELSCDHILEVRLLESDIKFAGVMSYARLGLDLQLVRARDGRPRWRASHVATRIGGSPPFSLISAPLSAAQSFLMASDNELLPSMVDDVVRRIMTTFPDTA